MKPPVRERTGLERAAGKILQREMKQGNLPGKKRQKEIVVRDGLPVGIAEIDARFVALAGTSFLPLVFRHFFLGVGSRTRAKRTYCCWCGWLPISFYVPRRIHD